MLTVLWVTVLSTTFWSTVSVNSSDCSRLSSHYFQWLNTDGSLVLPKGVKTKHEENDYCCGEDCKEGWSSLYNSECKYCAKKKSVVCYGSEVKSMPDTSTMPSKKLSSFKMSAIGLIALPPKSFHGLSIDRLTIENSDLTYMSYETFHGVKSIRSVSLVNNTLRYLYQSDILFHYVKGLSVLSVENNGLRVLSSRSSAELKNLEYLSLAGNPLYSLDVFFLQNSGLQFLNLRSVTFKVTTSNLDTSGFSSLPNTLTTLDFSKAKISIPQFEKIMVLLGGKNITTLNLSYLDCYAAQLLIALIPVRRTLQYLSLEGTSMNNTFPFLFPGTFVSLRELNLRHCMISDLTGGNVFQAFPNLNILSLSGNTFIKLDVSFFINLPTLNYLDLSANTVFKIGIENGPVAENLRVMDLSFVNFDVDGDSLQYLFESLPGIEMLSLCSSNIDSSHIKTLQTLRDLKYLDASDTLKNYPEMINAYNDLFVSLNSSLEELYFAGNNFKFANNFPPLSTLLPSLKMLDLSDNLIRELTPSMFGPTLKHLKISQNLITTWYSPIICEKSHLRFLDISNNQITYISDAMIEDFYKLNFLSVDKNPLLCHDKLIHVVCANVENETHSLTMLNWEQYQCYDTYSNNYRLFSHPEACDEYFREVSTTTRNTVNYPTLKPKKPQVTSLQRVYWAYIGIAPLVLLAVAGSIVYLKWWNIRCYVHRYFSLKKARKLRKYGDQLVRPEIHYDVFVSYSDVDRSWVLDYLIPNMETDGDISLCFHERDFQVGLSILENIMECMDQSHSLLLIVSRGFVRSKWCQFEMHLAQYRLIETIRDQLVLVLLEDIPRSVRPQTLHHLMMTKTYLIWPHQPCKGDATELFWKRLKRALKPNHNYIFDI